MKKIISIFAAVLSLGAAVAQPAVGTWSDTGPVPFPINVSGQVNGMGRVSQIKFHATNPAKRYAVSSSGGLFISVDTGKTWTHTPGTDVLPTTACSAVCIDYTDDNILYLSTGDQNYYSDWYGMYKSIDGGTTWNPSNIGIGTRMSVDIVMDPTNHNAIVAATDDGIWKSPDAGATWTKTLDSGQLRSMKVRPGSSSVLYAATGYNFFKSHDMGSTWTLISTGVTVPSGNEGIRIAVTPADTNLVYLGTTGGYGTILRSTDGGNSFSLIYANDSQCIVCYDSTVASGSQGYYNFNLCVNPINPNELLLGSHCVWRSTDGGITWSWRTQWWHQIHTDMHDLEFDPYVPNRRWNANDGGVWASTDTLATTWSPSCYGLAATEMYHSAQDPTVRQLVSAGTQDNGELYYDGAWKCNRGGDWGARCNMDYLGKGTVYYDNGSRRDLSPLSGDYTYDAPYTVTNTFHIEFSKMLPNTAVIGTDSIWTSRNINSSSPSWTFLETLGEDIQSVAMSKADSNTLFAVTNNNHLLVCTNLLSGSPTFSVLGTPAATNVAACVTTDKHAANVVYLSCGTTLYRSTDHGATWANITYTLPTYNILKVISDDYSTTERLFVATGSYIFYKDNTTTTWTLTSGMPTVAGFTDMNVYNDSTSASILRLSTYGRGAWECNIFNNYPPSGMFASNKQQLCVGDTVVYKKDAYGSVTSFQWLFPGGIPATSTADSPMVIYASSGLYNATLILTGTYGNDTIKYSNYINVSAGDTGSFVEGFEESSFPPIGWTQQSASGLTWAWADSIGGYGASLHSAYFNNFNNDAGGNHDRFILPRLDLTFALSAYMKFDVAYSYYPSYKDSLLVDVSTDCGRTFTTVYIKDSSILATAPDTTQFFVPSATEWRTDSVNLNAFLGNSVEVAFDNVGHYGQNIYIDNVDIMVVNPPLGLANTQSKAFQAYCFPNPASNELNVAYNGMPVGKMTLAVMDIAGRVLREQDFHIAASAGTVSVPINDLAIGAYFVIVSGAGQEQHLRFVKL